MWKKSVKQQTLRGRCKKACHWRNLFRVKKHCDICMLIAAVGVSRSVVALIQIKVMMVTAERHAEGGGKSGPNSRHLF